MGNPASRFRSIGVWLALKPPAFAACREADTPAVEHALAKRATPCGIREEQVTVYRHLFVARGAKQCSECKAKARAADAAASM